MKTVCAWCDVVLGGENDPGPVSHGICEECEREFEAVVDADQAEAWLAGLEAAARAAARAYKAEPTPTRYRAAVEAREQLERERRALRGDECPLCDGAGEAVSGLLPAGLTAPAEYVYSPCPLCDGHGNVMPETREAWERDDDA